MRRAGRCGKRSVSTCPRERALTYSSMFAKPPAAWRISWRRRSSPSSAAYIRSTASASSDKLVMTAATCGAPEMPEKVAPPLKSTRTRLTCSGLCDPMRPTTKVRSSSDLNEHGLWVRYRIFARAHRGARQGVCRHQCKITHKITKHVTAGQRVFL